ncbi:minor capsid protein [Thermoanaerobacterium sp. DL9XJH110]|uniref:minor capsid protein n=1 Tax=Thermoanaerobacterium sp. DL9XJH110 TaxID=3386643 RepID=UPI003BB76D51
MMLIEEIAKFLQTHGIGALGNDIFIGFQPAEPDNCITILETGGYRPDYIEAIRYPTFQFIVRNIDYALANSKAEEIFALFHSKENYSLGDFYIYYSEFAQEPTYIGQDTNGRYEISLNLEITRRY